jgi:hypothetical protein
MGAKYDFIGGVRGKHHRAMQAGYSITVHQEDGTTLTQEVVLKKGAVLRNRISVRISRIQNQ